MPPYSKAKSSAAQFVCLAVFVAFTSLASPPAGAKETAGFGLFAMFKVGDLPKYRRLLTGLEEELGKRGCGVSLEGPVKSEYGDIDVRRPNRYIHLRCERPLLRDRAGRAVVLKLRRVAANLVALEGPLTLRPGAQSTSPRPARDYIFKVSHYNNSDPDRREGNLLALTRLAAKRADRYQTEGEIAVTDAIGMRRPDEVVILFYDNPKQGDRFRKNSPDVIKLINAFNRRHLADFIYYGASTDR